jgi:hypothetical protein
MCRRLILPRSSGCHNSEDRNMNLHRILLIMLMMLLVQYLRVSFEYKDLLYANSFHCCGNSSLFHIERISLRILECNASPPALINSSGNYSVPGDLYRNSFPLAISTLTRLGSDIHVSNMKSMPK